MRGGGDDATTVLMLAWLSCLVNGRRPLTVPERGRLRLLLFVLRTRSPSSESEPARVWKTISELELEPSSSSGSASANDALSYAAAASESGTFAPPRNDTLRPRTRGRVRASDVGTDAEGTSTGSDTLFAMPLDIVGSETLLLMPAISCAGSIVSFARSTMWRSGEPGLDELGVEPALRADNALPELLRRKDGALTVRPVASALAWCFSSDDTAGLPTPLRLADADEAVDPDAAASDITMGAE